MAKIKILPENLSNMIAAGEVVERPVSIVKELVENSIDAGSDRIDVQVKDGGKRYIRVADNGFGMSRDDALLSLERHATSKIETPSDLFGITTMGFRGEALASIASVSRLTIKTKEKGKLEGTEVFTEGGIIKNVGAAGIPAGTIVEVRDLFYNTPARKKFLKTTNTEIGHISDYVMRTALAYPCIAFSLRHDKSTLCDIAACSEPGERVRMLLSGGDAGKLIEIFEEQRDLKLSGYISPPSIQRSTASGIYIYVNGRFVRDKVIRHALLQGYGNFIMKGKYPLVMLFVEIDPSEVDVNVHPAKSEVRFRDARKIHDLVSASIERSLRKLEWLPTGADSGGQTERIKAAAAGFLRKNEKFHAGNEPALAEDGLFYGKDIKTVVSGHTEGREVPGVKRGEEDFKAFCGYFSSLKVIGQLDEMYILCESRNGLVVIDQHAAYERMAFEELKSGYEKRSFKTQDLLIPETVEFSPGEASTLEENIEEIKRLGFDIENFGGRSFVVKAAPSILGARSVRGIIVDIVSELVELPSSRRFEDALEDILKRIACHSVIRGRRAMSFAEMKDLLERMDLSGIVPHCPHGRPSNIEIPLTELEKRFERT